MSSVSDVGPIPDATFLYTFVWPKAIDHRSLGQRPRTDVGSCKRPALRGKPQPMAVVDYFVTVHGAIDWKKFLFLQSVNGYNK